MAINAFIFRHIFKDDAATDCVDSGIGFFHGEAVEDYAYGCFRKALWATFGGHGKKIERGTDSGFRFLSVPQVRFLGMRHLRIGATLVGYSAVVIFIFRMIPEACVSDKRFLNSTIDYYVMGALFMGLIFIKGVDSLEYFRLPEFNVRSITAMCVAAAMVSPAFIAGGNEMKPWSIAIPGEIFLLGIGFGEEMFARGLCFGMLRKYGQRNAIIFSSVVFGLLHLNLYVGKYWDLWNAYHHVISAGLFGVIAAQVMIMTRSIWVSVIFHALSDWHIVFERVIQDSSDPLPPLTLYENLMDPLGQFLIYGPIILFLARVNRGGWPRWMQKIAVRWKLVVPVSALD
jgi:membrane protease YdiL (CAAX protease family)